MRYIALPTVKTAFVKTKVFRGEPLITRLKKIIGAPYDVFAIENVKDNEGQYIGKPPYFRVTGVKPNAELTLEEIARQTIDFSRVDKWVGNYGFRKILNVPSARANVSDERVREMLSLGEVNTQSYRQ